MALRVFRKLAWSLLDGDYAEFAARIRRELYERDRSR
jgi:hypothetical protein